MHDLVCDRFEVHIAERPTKRPTNNSTVRYDEAPELPFMVVDHKRGQVWQIERVKRSYGYLYGEVDNISIKLARYEVVK